MATNDDEVRPLLRSWIKVNELCAMEMKKLADELETLTKNCAITKCVGSALSVAGTLGLIGAGVATLISGGLAAPAIPIAAAAGGVGISLGTYITESFLSSKTMEKVKEEEKKTDEIKEQILQLSKDLGVTGLYVTRRHSREGLIDFASHDASPREKELHPDVLAALVTILTIFNMQSGNLSVGSHHDIEKLIGCIAGIALGTIVRKSVMVVAGGLALALILPEAIQDWKKLIENNHTTEASQSVRKEADTILEICQILKDQFGDI